MISYEKDCSFSYYQSSGAHLHSLRQSLKAKDSINQRVKPTELVRQAAQGNVEWVTIIHHLLHKSTLVSNISRQVRFMVSNRATSNMICYIITVVR